MSTLSEAPVISVVVLNWNAAPWIPRCLESLRRQTIASRIEVLFTDNASSDESERIARECLSGWPNGRFIQTGGNYGYGGGCNRGARQARGRYLLFLNPDVWLEPNCLEELLAAAERSQAGAVAAMILDYADDAVQWWLDSGINLFGWVVRGKPRDDGTTYSCGTFPFIRTEFFWRIGGYDEEFFMYGEEEDLAWRIWISGGRVSPAPKARIHHRSEAAVNPKGGERITEFRTSERKRYYANRNHLLVILKNAQHVLLLTALMFLGLMLLEGVFWLVCLRRGSLAWAAGVKPLLDCWRLRRHILAQRRQFRPVREHGDWWMLRFFRWQSGRAADMKKLLRFGLPKAD